MYFTWVSSRSKLYTELGLESLQSRRRLRCLCVLHKIVSNALPTYLCKSIKSVQIRSFFLSLISKYEKIWPRKNTVSEHFWRSVEVWQGPKYTSGCDFDFTVHETCIILHKAVWNHVLSFCQWKDISYFLIKSQ